MNRKIPVPESELRRLAADRMSVVRIAKAMRLSPGVVQRAMVEYGIPRGGYSGGTRVGAGTRQERAARPEPDTFRGSAGCKGGSCGLAADAEPMARTEDDRRCWRQLRDWPAGIWFEDARVGPEPRGHIRPDRFTDSMMGNSAAMMVEA